MSSQVLEDFSPEVSTIGLGFKRPWAGMNALSFGDPNGETVDRDTLVRVTNSLNRETYYRHNQDDYGGASTSWVINHNLNNSLPVIIVQDNMGNYVPVINPDIPNATENSITLLWDVAISGIAHVYGGIGGAYASRKRVEFVQAAASTLWNIEHNLDEKVPTVKVLNNQGKEVVCKPDYENATGQKISLKFGNPISGTAYIGTR